MEYSLELRRRDSGSNDGARLPICMSVLSLVWLSLFALPALSQDLSGVWRDENAYERDKTEPQLSTVAFADGRPHGTFDSEPYFEIARAQVDGVHQLFFRSDIGSVFASVMPVEGEEGQFDIIDLREASKGTHLARLRYGTDICANKPACFQLEVDKTVGDLFPVDPDSIVRYVPMEVYDAKTALPRPQGWDDTFLPMSANFDELLKCYRLKDLDPTDLQATSGCGLRLFVEPDIGSYAFEQKNGHAIPFGWKFRARDDFDGNEKLRTTESMRDVEQATKLDIGAKASANIAGFTASVDVDVVTQRAFEQMTGKKSIRLEAHYTSMNFSLVMNRQYVIMSERFTDDVIDLFEAYREDETSEIYQKLFQKFFNDWGTHYTNAITYGARGYRHYYLTEDQVRAAHSQKLNVAVGVCAGYKGAVAKIKACANVANDQHMADKISKNNILSTTDFKCFGGGGCNEGVPSGVGEKPILSDLRPLSDLFAPPFFSDLFRTDPVAFTALRERASQEVFNRAFTRQDGADTEVFRFAEFAQTQAGQGPTLLCGPDSVLSPASPQSFAAGSCCQTGKPVVAALAPQEGDPPPQQTTYGAMISSMPEGQMNLTDPDGALLTKAGNFITGVQVEYEGLSAIQPDAVPMQRGNGIDALTIDYYYPQVPDLQKACVDQMQDGAAPQGAPPNVSCVISNGQQVLDFKRACSTQFGNESVPIYKELKGMTLCAREVEFTSDSDAWCKATYGPGAAGTVSRETTLDGYIFYSQACAKPDGTIVQIDSEAICRDQFGSDFAIVQIRDGGIPYQCRGVWAPTRLAKAAPDAEIRAYPSLTPFEPANEDPADVIIPLQWDGESAKTCNGVSLDMVFGLRARNAADLLAIGQ
ncbi:MAC/perforin domain-containing protein [Sedimentitalea arenosa]|uniref:MACPF domain-containing protein n=1 Tax=Sedimentitalea arenosa TaxID=2798803 RepID=A0A8J7IMR5_9RHOB|nr:MAC/perforin domain-containing protein [Arenibacterium arenosum]MBJ6370651.1 hypothetical protein [Arenibacterium arenosum]